MTENTLVMLKKADKLEPILLQRLPDSANLCNLLKMSMNNKEKADIHWYSLRGELSSCSWILVSVLREDVDFEYLVSGPKYVPVDEGMAEAISRVHNPIDWDRKYTFVGLEPSISELVYHMSVRIKANTTNVIPCWFMYMPQEQARTFALSTDNLPPGVTLSSLKGEEGQKFICDSWKWKKPRTDEMVGRVLDLYPSAGVRLNGRLVSGILTKTHGSIGLAHTDPGHRYKGYAKIAHKALIRKWLDEGLIPTIYIEINNESSRKFHEKLGFRLVGRTDYFEFTSIKH